TPATPLSPAPIDSESKNQNKTSLAATNEIHLPRTLRDSDRKEEKAANTDSSHKASILSKLNPPSQKHNDPSPAVFQSMDSAAAEKNGITLPLTLRNKPAEEDKEKRPTPGAWPSTSTIDTAIADSK